MFIRKCCRTGTLTEIRELCISTSCYHMLYVGTWANLLLNPKMKPKLFKPWEDLHNFSNIHLSTHFSLCHHGSWAPCSGNHATYNLGVTSTTTASRWEPSSQILLPLVKGSCKDPWSPRSDCQYPCLCMQVSKDLQPQLDKQLSQLKAVGYGQFESPIISQHSHL